MLVSSAISSVRVEDSVAARAGKLARPWPDVSFFIATLERLAQLGVGFGFELEVFAQTRELQLDVHERALVSLLRLDGGVEFARMRDEFDFSNSAFSRASRMSACASETILFASFVESADDATYCARAAASSAFSPRALSPPSACASACAARIRRRPIEQLSLLSQSLLQISRRAFRRDRLPRRLASSNSALSGLFRDFAYHRRAAVVGDLVEVSRARDRGQPQFSRHLPDDARPARASRARATPPTHESARTFPSLSASCSLQ